MNGHLPPNVAMFMIDDGGDVHPMHLHPGVWMDHCDNLADAAQGMVAHLMYTGVSTPYGTGGAERNDWE